MRSIDRLSPKNNTFFALLQDHHPAAAFTLQQQLPLG
jgi:hypothetical protein